LGKIGQSVFPNKTELKNQRARPSSFNRLSPPFSWSTKKESGRSTRRLYSSPSFSSPFYSLSSSLWVWAGVECQTMEDEMRMGSSTIVKSKTTKACVAVPLLHGVLNLRTSHPFFKCLYFGAFFAFRGYGWVRGLKITMSMNLLHGLIIFVSCSPLMLSFHIGGVLGLAHQKNQAKHLPKWRRGLLPLLPTSPSSPYAPPKCLCHFFILRGLFSLSCPKVRSVTLSIICIMYGV
jgi:hypothetical protein